MRKYLYKIFMIFAMLWLGCERIAEDVEPSDVETPVETGGRVYYTFQNSIVAIDPISLVTSSEIERINILTTPTYGSISFSDNNLLVYTPNDNIKEATEQLSLEAVKKNGTKTINEITINIIAEDFKMPCINIAMTDKVKLDINSTIIIDVLKNDVICEGVFKQLSIFKDPENGVVNKTLDNKIEYTPNTGFKGNDRFLYAIDVEKDGKIIKKIAFCQIQVIDTACKTILKIDNAFLKQQNFIEPINIPVLANDELCPNDLSKGKLELEQSPKKGACQILPNKTIVYQLSFGTAPIPTFRDSFEYKFTTALGEVLTSKVMIQTLPLGCKLTAKPDEFIVSKLGIKGKDFITLNILENDELCAYTFSELKVKVSSNDAAGGGGVPLKDIGVTSSNKIVLKIPKGNLPPEISFYYKTIADKGEETLLALVKIKFVD